MAHNLEQEEVSVLELLDRVLNKGVIINGEIVISVADIDLVYVGIKLMLSSVETMEKLKHKSRQEMLELE